MIMSLPSNQKAYQALPCSVLCYSLACQHGDGSPRIPFPVKMHLYQSRLLAMFYSRHILFYVLPG
jgi:hypothetical protein